MKTMLGVAFSAKEEKVKNAQTLRKIEKTNLIIIYKISEVWKVESTPILPDKLDMSMNRCLTN
jgi:hypothetical protein